jgi:hypothetical protein
LGIKVSFAGRSFNSAHIEKISLENLVGTGKGAKVRDPEGELRADTDKAFR